MVKDCTPGTTYYVYDASGQRARKITESPNGGSKNARFYLGEFEIYREYASVGSATLERQTLHVMDVKQRIALIETQTVVNGAAVASPTPAQRYQLANHLGSACLELDESGGLISYEEYSPYGNTTFQAGSAAEVSLKRYRYTGKGRDEENGFTYHGARYCAPWLGRWTSCDPAGISEGLNHYVYGRSRPTRLVDPSGWGPKDPAIEAAKAAEQLHQAQHELPRLRGDVANLEQAQEGAMARLAHAKIAEDKMKLAGEKRSIIKGQEKLIKKLESDLGKTVEELHSANERLSELNERITELQQKIEALNEAQAEVEDIVDPETSLNQKIEGLKRGGKGGGGGGAPPTSPEGGAPPTSPEGGGGGGGASAARPSGGIPRKVSGAAIGAAIGAGLGAAYSLLTKGSIDPKDIAAGAAIGAFPILSIAGAKDEGGTAVPIMLYFAGSAIAKMLMSAVARAAYPVAGAAYPVAVVAAPVGVVVGTKVLMGGKTTLSLHGGWGGLVRYPGGVGSPRLPDED